AASRLCDPASPVLRCVGEALARLAREYPWARDGLSLTERRLLAALPATAVQAFLRGAAKAASPRLRRTRTCAALERLQAGGLVAREDGDRRVRTGLGDRVL